MVLPDVVVQREEVETQKEDVLVEVLVEVVSYHCALFAPGRDHNSPPKILLPGFELFCRNAQQAL